MSVSIGVILGSSRPNRNGKPVADWFMVQASQSKDVEFTLVDLKEENLPFLDEPNSPASKQYEHEHTKKWAKKIESFDGFIVITPEYNHSFPAILKNAFDFLYHEWSHKPIGFVSYGGSSGGLRAVEQLRLVAIELKMVPVRDQVLIPSIWNALQNDGVKKESVQGNLPAMIEEVVQWAKLLKT